MHVIHSRIQSLFRIKSELQEVYWNLVLESFAKSMIGIFVPIYLITLGYTLPGVFVFTLFFYVTMLLFPPLAARLASRVGLKHLILYRAPLLVAFYLFLVTLQFTPFSPGALAIAGILGGGAAVIYWIPLNAELVKNTKKIQEGREIAAAFVFPRMASLAAPTIAAIALTVIGFTAMFAIVIAIILASVIPLFATNDYRGRFRFSGKYAFAANVSFTPALFIKGLLLFTEAVVWPLFIFITLDSLLDVGFAASIAAMGIVFFTFVAGKLSDVVNKNTLMKIGGVAYSFVWVARMAASTQMDMFLLSLLGGMFFSLVRIPVFSMFCDAARGKKTLDWVVFREIWIGIGRVTIIAVLLFLTFTRSDAFPLLFGLVALFSLLHLKIRIRA